MTPETVLVIAILVPVLVVGLGLIVLPAYQAYRRGYNPFIWGLAGVFAMNPIFILVVLAVVPHRARVQMRQQFREELDRKLASVHGRSDATGDQHRADLFTIGDQATRLPERSIGDDATRL